MAVQPPEDDDPRPRVLWLIKGLGPGGAERLILTAAELGNHSEFRFEAAFALDWKTALVEDLQACGVPVTSLGVRRGWDPRWMLSLRRLLISRRYSVVHIHSPVMAIGIRLLKTTLPRRRRPVLISTEHNSWSSHRPLTRWANRLTFNADRVHLAVSEDTRQSLPGRLQPRVEVLVHGTSLAEAASARARRSRTRELLGAPADEVLVLTVANLRANKAYPDLLAAAREVIDRSTVPCRFLAVGQGPLAAEVRELHGQMGLADRFVLLGARTDVFDLMAASDVFVLASVVEGFPVALMEALAVGLPVVATAVGGVPDAIRPGVNGVLVPPSSPLELAQALLSMVGDVSARRLLAEGARRSGESFDAARAVRRVEEHYRQLIAQAAG